MRHRLIARLRLLCRAECHQAHARRGFWVLWAPPELGERAASGSQGAMSSFTESLNVGGLVVFGTVSSLLAKISELLNSVTLSIASTYT